MIVELAAGLDTPADEADFTALYKREYPRIARYMLRRGAGGLMADLVAETFVVAWRQRDQWRDLPDGQRLAWLYAVARKTLANSYRSARRANALTDRIAADRFPHEQSPSDPGATTVELIALNTAFAQLPEPDQELIRLVAWDGLTTAQAAAALGCRTGTAAMRLHRARTRLRTLIENPSRKGKS
jgi:RNA polymerase sigma-70 factor, ECF subfamily